MKAISITEKEVQAAFSVAKSEETKQVLTALFGPQKMEPTLDDYKTIKSYEDACKVLNIEPIYYGKTKVQAICEGTEGRWGNIQMLPKHIVALLKLETISRALWGRNWEPKSNADISKWFYYPGFTLCTKDEFYRLTKTQRDTLLFTLDGKFGYLDTIQRSSLAFTYFDIRLCQETEEKAEYFGRQFIELWAEYLKFNFEVGERL